MRYALRIMSAVLVGGALALAVSSLSSSTAAFASSRCTGGGVVQAAPSSGTSTRVIDGTGLTATIALDAHGTAAVTFTLAAPRSTDTPIVVRSYTGVSSQPLKSASGVIRAGETSARLV